MTSAKSFAPPTDILLNLCLTIVVPIIVGQLSRLKFAAQIDNFRLKIFSFGHINNMLLLTLFWATFCDTFSKDDIPVTWEVFLEMSLVWLLRLVCCCWWRAQKVSPLPRTFCWIFVWQLLFLLLLGNFWDSNSQLKSIILDSKFLALDT